MSAPAAKGAIVVTGASSGIGRACALRLDALGFDVFAGYRDPAAADSLRADASERLRPVRLDVTAQESIRAAADEVGAYLGEAGLRGLVNNAGIAVAGPLEFLPLDALRQQLEINVVGQVAVIQAFLAPLRQAGGRIVNMSSISGRFSAPFLGPYSASKHALEALSDSLRVELRQWGIDVAIIEPGAIETPIWEKSRAAANRIQADFPAEAETLYGRGMRGLQKRIAGIAGTPTDPVVDAVVHALTAKRPRVRYVVGRDARFRLLLDRLPTRFVDRLVARSLDL